MIENATSNLPLFDLKIKKKFKKTPLNIKQFKNPAHLFKKTATIRKRYSADTIRQCVVYSTPPIKSSQLVVLFTSFPHPKFE